MKNFFENIYIVIFYILSALSIFFSIMTIHTNKTLRSAVFLCLVMITNAGFFLLLGTEFLAIIQMLVYVSGIIILLIFVIMLTNTIEDDSTETPWIKKFIHIAIPCLFFMINAFVIIFAIPNKALYKHNIVMYDESNLAKIGFKILDINQNGYVLPFEILSLLLLIVLIGCLKISRK